MCLQCATDAITYKTSPIPGWYLMRATKDAWDKEPKEWEKDEWGLVKMNDPAFVWKLTPVPDPAFDLSDEEMDALPKDVWKTKQYTDYDDAVEELDTAMVLDPMTGYSLITAAKEAGYDPEKHGYRFSSWLVHRMGLIVRDEQPVSHDSEEVVEEGE